jgi:M6 family metalloprotease-like protein
MIYFTLLFKLILNATPLEMKRQIWTLFFFFLLIAIHQSAFAVKAYPYPVAIVQPDGTQLTIILRGDEHVKWAQTLDGYSIMRNSKGVFEYAILDSKYNMKPSGIKARNQSDRGDSDNQLLSKTKKGITYSRGQVGMMKSISRMVQKSSQRTFPTIGSIKLVCILIGFTDKPFSLTQTEFNDLFNQLGYSDDSATGSVYDYYKENSYGQLELTVTVAGPYTAAQNMAYYGANDADGNDVRPDVLVTEAVNLANPDVDYSNFDNDNDGYVDGVYVIYAGYGEEAGASEDAIWAHAWEISLVTLDGKNITSYSCSSELRSNSGMGITRIGVICHEFGHVMGASDFYDTDYAESGGEFEGTGNWDIMANGSWNNDGATPPHHNPYTKIYAYNWTIATTIASAISITLNNAEQNKNSFYRINTSTTNEYFLIENRQKLLFDTYLSGHGMIIYHVDGSYINLNKDFINASSHQGLYPVCASASGNPPTDYGTINGAGCPFPGTSLKTSFNDYTTPFSKSWAGVSTNKPISNISEDITNKTVSFDVSMALETSDTAYLSQNYPNPFDNLTTIDFKVIKSSKVSLTVYNSLGQIVDVIIDEFLFAGDYSEPWSPKGIAAGIYFYQLKAAGIKETKRLIKK